MADCRPFAANIPLDFLAPIRSKPYVKKRNLQSERRKSSVEFIGHTVKDARFLFYRYGRRCHIPSVQYIISFKVMANNDFKISLSAT